MTLEEAKKHLKRDIERLKKDESTDTHGWGDWYNGQWRGIQHALEILGMVDKPNKSSTGDEGV